VCAAHIGEVPISHNSFGRARSLSNVGIMSRLKRTRRIIVGGDWFSFDRPPATPSTSKNRTDCELLQLPEEIIEIVEGLALRIERRQRPAAVEEREPSELTSVCFSSTSPFSGSLPRRPTWCANSEGIVLDAAVECEHAADGQRW